MQSEPNPRVLLSHPVAPPSLPNRHPPTQFQASLWAGCEEQSGYRISGFSVATASLKPVKAAFYSGAGWERGWDTPPEVSYWSAERSVQEEKFPRQFLPQRLEVSTGSAPLGWLRHWMQLSFSIPLLSRARLLQPVMSSVAELSLRACGTINQ